MPRTKLSLDMDRLRTAVSAVRATSIAESAAFAEVFQAAGAEALAQLHAAHLAELNAIQQLLTSMELVERRHPALFTVPEKA